MKEQIVKNILIFLDRVQVTGKESIAWCEAVQALAEELNSPVVPSAPPG